MEHWYQDHDGFGKTIPGNHFWQAEQLRQACRDADDALIAHFRQEHRNLTPKASSSSPQPSDIPGRASRLHL
jgi:hypothetical protein